MKKIFLLLVAVLLMGGTTTVKAQSNYIYADPVYVEAGQEAELIIRMDYFNPLADVGLWNFKLNMPDGIELATPDNPYESCTLSREAYDSPIEDDMKYTMFHLSINPVYKAVYFDFRTYQRNSFPLVFDPMKSTHCELVRVVIKSNVTQTLNPVISDVTIRDTHTKHLVMNGVNQCAEYDNTLYIKDTEAYLGSDFTLSVRMNNTIAAEAFSFEIILPLGMDFVTDENGNYMISLSEERNAAGCMNTFSVIKLDGWLNNVVRVVAASPTGAAIPPGNGEVCTMKVRPGTGMNKGQYQVTMRNISVADTEAVEHDIAELPTIITLLAPDVGDVNNDGKVTVTDLTAIAHHILGNTPANFSETAADANRDGLINVADYTAVAHLLLYGSITPPQGSRSVGADASQRRKIGTNTGLDNMVYIAPVKAIAGEDLTLSVRMRNSVDAEGFQFNLTLPAGVTLVTDGEGKAEASLSEERTTATRTNTFATSIHSDGSLTVMAASINASTISAGDGEVCTVKVHIADDLADGVFTLSLKDVAISDAAACSHNVDVVESKLTVGDASAIVSVTSETGKTACFNLQGCRVTDTSRPGIYIENGRKRVVSR